MTMLFVILYDALMIVNRSNQTSHDRHIVDHIDTSICIVFDEHNESSNMQHITNDYQLSTIQCTYEQYEHDTAAQHNVYITLIAILLWPTIRRLVRLMQREIICIRDHLIA